ncbi:MULTISPECIES: hemerythrin domain-containing protein [unclassified Streptomyces]|uniref:hemerythrin domain-containing protein n=1 Tax=unclassified Streptomyces TaxID=2593676 RepID=UPI00093E836C|nr:MULTISPECIES: hemerythrin domain-containing protein [unclassified Streptomyces]OKK03647.1 hemerythrin [Streptomyces sp. CB03234]ORT56744.1 hemerythrin [Streptomyces sp. CB03238]
MSSAKQERAEAAKLPDDDVIGVLLRQHALIRDLFSEVKGAEGGRPKQEAFDALRALLAVHETAEEMILRPVATDTAGAAEADARNREEKAANQVLAELERMDVSSPEFDELLRRFEKDVIEHAEHEEKEEFPSVLQECPEAKRKRLGGQLQLVEKLAPTHPHPRAAGSPTAQWVVGPFASMLDRTRDALKHVTSR